MDTVASIGGRVTDVGAYLREQRENARLSVRQLATLAGVSNPYLSQVERGLRKPSAEMLQQIAKGLRISAEALYIRAGILDEELRVGVERAVHADPDLSDRQKRVLLDIYASFRAENARAAAEDVVAAVPRRRPGTRTTSSVPAPAKRAAKRAAKAAAAETGAAERPARSRRRAPAAVPDVAPDAPSDVTETPEPDATVTPEPTATSDAAAATGRRGTGERTTRRGAPRAASTRKRTTRTTSERPDPSAADPASGPTTPSVGTPDTP